MYLPHLFAYVPASMPASAAASAPRPSPVRRGNQVRRSTTMQAHTPPPPLRGGPPRRVRRPLCSRAPCAVRDGTRCADCLSCA